jgi:Ca-activated chloride channel family protein
MSTSKPSVLVFLFLSAIPSIALGFEADPDTNQGPLSIHLRSRTPVDAAGVPTPHLRGGVSLVMIPVHVTTPFGASVTTLTRDNFLVFEDNVQQQIVSFAKDDAPISIGLLLDCSGSMRNKMRTSADAATAFFKTANSKDEFFLVEFSEKPKLVIPFTTDPGELSREIARTRPFGRTSLLDAIHLAIREMKGARHSRKALVIISDGGDNRSRHTSGQIKSAILESDVQLYAMGIFDAEADPKKQSPEEQNGPELLEALAEMSGGRHFPVDNLEDLPSIGARIGSELRNQYLLGYSSTNPVFDGKYRKVKLTVAAPQEPSPLRTQYRRGYYAPTE